MTSKTIVKAIGQAILGIFFLVLAYWFGVVGYTTTTYYGLYEVRHTYPIAGILFGIMGLLILIFRPIGAFIEKREENAKKKLIEKYKK